MKSKIKIFLSCFLCILLMFSGCGSVEDNAATESENDNKVSVQMSADEEEPEISDDESIEEVRENSEESQTEKVETKPIKENHDAVKDTAANVQQAENETQVLERDLNSSENENVNQEQDKSVEKQSDSIAKTDTKSEKEKASSEKKSVEKGTVSESDLAIKNLNKAPSKKSEIKEEHVQKKDEKTFPEADFQTSATKLQQSDDKAKDENTGGRKDSQSEFQVPKEQDVKKNICTISVRCDNILKNKDNLTREKAALVPENGVIYAKCEVEFSEGESLFDVLRRELREKGIHMEFNESVANKSVYIEGINNIYEFDCGDLSGWVYKVNGKMGNVGCSRYIVKPGDIIEWVYTCDLGRDVM